MLIWSWYLNAGLRVVQMYAISKCGVCDFYIICCKNWVNQSVENKALDVYMSDLDLEYVKLFSFYT